MDILSHSLSGVAFGTVIASFTDKGFKRKAGVVLLSGFGGALPDIDAISLWSKFDTTIGHFFGLAHSGNEIYFSKFWYSHHGAMHSLLVAGIVTLIIGILLSLFSFSCTTCPPTPHRPYTLFPYTTLSRSRRRIR